MIRLNNDNYFINYVSVRFILCAAIALLAVSCGEDSESEDDEGVTIGAGSGGSGGSSGTQSALESVASNMLPDSLESDSTSLLLEGDDPCADADGFFDCQPNLLKLYMGISKDIVGMVADIVENTSQFIDSREVGTSGTETIDDSDDISEIEYSVTSADEYEIKVYTDDGAFFYLSVNTTEDVHIYNLTVDGDNVPEDEGPGGLINVDIEFEDEDIFSVAINMTELSCDDDDVRAPGAITLDIDKGADQWQGKAMLYHPRWLVDNDATCSTEATDDTAMFMYTDFVGNDDNTTASLYLMDSTVEGTDEFADWPASEFCNNFSGICSSGYGFEDPNPVSSYENAFCVTEDSTTWGEACDDLSEEDYSSEDNWLTPEELTAISLSMPDVIEE